MEKIPGFPVVKQYGYLINNWLKNISISKH